MKKIVCKPGLITMMMITSLLLPLAVFAAENEPAAAAAQAAVAVSTVVAIDKENRTLTLKEENGEKWDYVAGPEVRNFDQVKRGDQVIAKYFAAFAMAITNTKAAIPARLDEVEVARAKQGEKPAVQFTHTVRAVGKVMAIDKEARIVTIKGATQSVEMEVSPKVDLSKINIGDEVEAAYIKSYGVKVEPAPAVSGTIEFTTTAAAFIVGVEWGHGTMTMHDGAVYSFDIKGVSVIDVGISKVEAKGEIFKLVEASDLQGTYAAGEAGAVVVAGGSALTMQNSKDVIIKVRSKQTGLKLTLAPEGLRISNVKRVP